NRWCDYTLIKKYTVKKGDQVKLSFTTQIWQETQVVPMLNGVVVNDIKKEDKGDKSYFYTISFTIPEDVKENTLVLDTTEHAGGSGGSGLPVTESSYTLNADDPIGDVTTSEKIELSNINAWTYITQAENDAIYTVSEVKVNGKPLDESNFTVSYYNNDGIYHGEIVITNKQKEKVYVLPSTGGSGTTRYVIGGVALMLLATFLYTYKNRHKPERRTLP
ncbi:MAG: LPXTG cell wall anchor domain-containing protein, partial [Phoenicibacter congonensis]|nr:LPXTG cell wall anchor domain-containing protein [Phoenicibacter congonensis]